MDNSKLQHNGESHSTDASLGLNQVNPLSQTQSDMPLSQWRGSLTTFDGFTGTRPTQELNNAAWGEISNLLCPENPAVIADKKQGQYVVPCLLKEALLVGKTLDAAIQNGQSTTGKMRSKQHVTVADFLIIDIDGMTDADFMSGLDNIKGDSLTFLAYTTHSHGRADKMGMRARIAIPLDRSVNTEDYAAAWHGFDSLYWNGQAGLADSSGANLYQQQGTWCCDPSRASLATFWSSHDGVVSTDGLIALGRTALASNSAKMPSDSEGSRKIITSIDTKVVARYSSNLSIVEYPSSDANKVAYACQQIGDFRNSKGSDQREPLWRNCLGVVGFCVNGADYCQEWSSGHPGYDERKTTEKLANRMKIAPTTCDQFKKSNPAGCSGCTERCKSPITLGTADAFEIIESGEDDSAMVATSTVQIEVRACDLGLDTTKPSAPQNDDEVIALLAGMSPMNYDRVRREKAKLLGVQIKTLDLMVKQARNEETESNNLHFAEVEPHPDPIDPSQLLDEISETIRRFIVLDKEQADAAALWIAFTWFIDVVDVAPLAIINAPEKSCGKSQMLDLMGRMTSRPISAANSSTAFLFRTVELWTPTLLIDEADTFVKENMEMKGMINAGYTRANAFVGRVVGDNHDPKLFNVWGAKALAGIALERHLPDPTMSRAIVFELRKKLPHEQVTKLRDAEDGLFDGIASKLARLCEDYAKKVKVARPVLPEKLNDRAQDNWRPLLAIAECAGAEWVQRATEAALKLSSTGEKSVSTANQLLADIKQVFEVKETSRMKSTDLISELCEDEESGWSTYNRGKPLTPRQLAKILSQYGIQSKTVRDKHSTPKGYELAQFADVFARYLDAPQKLPQQRNIST